MSDDTTDRLDRLEWLVERQSETIDALREEVAVLGGDRDDGDGRNAPVSRRTALRAGGLLALLGIGAGTASADPQGQVGTSTDPLTALYTESLNGGLTGDQAVSDLLGDGLAIDSGSLTVDGVRAWADADADDLLEPTGLATGVEVSTVRSPAGSGLTLETDDGTRTLELGVPSSAGIDTAGGNVVAGHPNNAVNNDAVGVVIGGGGANKGNENSVGGHYATVGGGVGNTASGIEATVGGGNDNEANGDWATVGGGEDNTASGGAATVAGGEDNTASEDWATVPGGSNNTASGSYSFAAGRGADTNGHDGAFVWGDSSFRTVSSDFDDQVVFQANGGMKVYTASDTSMDTGAELPAGSTSWAALSTRTAKSDIEAVQPAEVLERVESLEVATWRYDAEDEAVRHMGPIAEDFEDAFGLGHDADRISTVDADGVALAAIQGLAQKLDAKDECIDDLASDTDDLRAENDRLRERNAELEARLDRVEAHLGLDADRQRGIADD